MTPALKRERVRLCSRQFAGVYLFTWLRLGAVWFLIGMERE